MNGYGRFSPNGLDGFDEWRNVIFLRQPEHPIINAQIIGAQGSLAQDDLAGAQAQVEALLPTLAEVPHAGYNSPFFIYLTTYRVLAAGADRRATPLLAQGHDLLQQVATPLDEESRH